MKNAATGTGAKAQTQTCEKPSDSEAGAEFVRNLMHAGARAQQILAKFLHHQAETHEPRDPFNLGGTFLALLQGMVTQPTAIFDSQLKLWSDYVGLWESAVDRLLGGTPAPVIAPAPGDKRFRDQEWQENQIFDFIKQSYLLTAHWLQSTAARVEGLDPQTQARAAFYVRQFADAIAPTNFALTNPEVLRTTLASKGENLVKGLDNLLADLERGHGQLAIRQSADAFAVGENLALTPGKVVWRGELFELLQYAPTTAEVYERPLLIFPPWINKYYIMDLRPDNSLIIWLVGRGYSVFVVSWVNPDRKLAQKSFEDYMREGVFQALDAVEQATGAREVNTAGYCIGGTLLGASLAYMTQTGDRRIHSATFCAAQVDFSEAGELKNFVDEAQLRALERQMDAAGGVLEGRKMANTFNMLRANELIWSFVVNNYLLGKTPAPFDLLYWNSDSTRMPKKMHLFYLRECYRDNSLAKGKMKFGEVTLDLGKVDVPIYLLSAKEDHIAPIHSLYKETKLFKGPRRFVMAGSGHVAGVINPPAAGKYQYWTNAKLPATVEEWQASAKEHSGSWWIDWDRWLAQRSGAKVSARRPGEGKLKALGDAPGTYVRVKGSPLTNPPTAAPAP
jgi:polyhydroxyalkanoate synthase